jgi:homoserine kinase
VAPATVLTVRVPATVANVGAGFDVLAAAVGVHAEVTLALTSASSVRVPGLDVPQDETNLIYRSAIAVAALAGYRGAFTIEARTPIPLRSGLGSSATAIVAGLVGANRLLGGPIDHKGLLRLAADIEGHPDNVAAALFGGVVIVTRDGSSYVWTRIVPALLLAVVLVLPAIEVATTHARGLLPAQVSREDAVFNLGRVALLVAALVQGRGDLLRLALADRLHQPYRASLVPGFDRVLDAARGAGAYGAVLSGSGPTVAALTPPDAASDVGEAMRRAFEQAGVESRVVHTSVEPRGAVESETAAVGRG